MRTSQLDTVDRQLLHALTMAPRASFRLLAAVLGVSDQTVARRYRRLADTAGLRVFGLIDGPRAGWVDWLVRLQAERRPRRHRQRVEKLAVHLIELTDFHGYKRNDVEIRLDSC